MAENSLQRMSVNEIADEARRSITDKRAFNVEPEAIVDDVPPPCSSVPCWGSVCYYWTKIGLTLQTLLGVLVGLAVGLIVPAVSGPVDADGDIIAFVAYPGELFVSALKLVVVPMIATAMILAVIKLGDLSKIRFIGTRALGYYLTTTFIAAFEGLAMVNLFKPGVGSNDMVGTQTDSAVADKSTRDVFLDVGRSMLPGNLVTAFQTPNILGIIVFCLLFGYYINKDADQAKKEVVLHFFDACNTALMGIVNMIIGFTPLGICSLVMGEVMKQEDLANMLSQLGIYLLAVFAGLLLHALVVYPSIFLAITRTNPLRVYRGLVQPVLTAFATSSSAATLPVTIKAVEDLGVHEDISRFMLPLGSTINMDGTAIYFPIAVIFLANFQSVSLNFGQQIAVAFVSSFVSIGAAPIPNAGLVYLILIMDSVSIPFTPAISFILAVDWFVDRLQTVTNIVGDSFGATLLNHLRQRHEGKHASIELEAPPKPASGEVQV